MFIEKIKKIFGLQNILITIIILIILIVTVFHSQFFSHIGFENIGKVEGNYEFTKSMLFNIFFPLLITTYGIVVFFYRDKIEFSKTVYLSIIGFLGVIITSTLIGEIFYNSLFGSESKGHGFFFWINLLSLFLVFQYIYHQKKESIIENGFIFSGIFLSIVGIYEYFFPSFDYGDLGNRLISTLGHPNYVAFVLVLLTPLVFLKLKEAKSNIQKHVFLAINLLFIIALLLTKSAIGIFLVLSFYYFHQNIIHKRFKVIIYLLGIIIGFGIIFYTAPEKFSSFISRFYIWETTLKIIFSDLKIFFFGVGPDNLGLLFDIAKVPELYIFENYGFGADRPHNIFLSLWVHFGIFGLSGFLILLKILFPFHLEKWRHYALFLGIVFLSFNFSNVLGYILLIFIISGILYRKYKFSENIQATHIQSILFIFLVSSLFGSYYSYKYIISESANYSENHTFALKEFPYKNTNHFKNYKMYQGLEAENYFYSEQYYLYKIYYSSTFEKECSELIKYYPTIENYFYCGELFENKADTKNALYYYKIGVKKFPDIWLDNSQYYDNILVEKFASKKRILSPKYSRIQEILDYIKKHTGKSI